VTHYDLAFLSTMMASKGYEARAKQFPALERMVSANVVPASDAVRAFKPYVVEEVQAERFGATPFRVGIIGVTDAPKGGATVSGYKLIDPATAVQQHYRALRETCDAVVVLAYMDRRALQAIEPAVPGVDAFVAAHAFPVQRYDGDVETPAYVFAATQGKAVGELRFYPLAAASGSKRYGRLTMRTVSLDRDVPNAPIALQLTRDALKAFRRLPQ
jgi:2',3'-cyclic-nucleotide 2'-phosphodiesterase (5'-nucleotidase family)